MGGSAGLRGYLIQTLVALLDMIDSDTNWDAVTLEPEHKSEKIDILWEYSGKKTKAVQVKSSQNRITVGQVNRWAHDFNSARHCADELELTLVGCCSPRVAALCKPGEVKVRLSENTDFDGLKAEAACRLKKFLEVQGLPSGSDRDRENWVAILRSNLSDFSLTQYKFTRPELIDCLNGWITQDIEGDLRRAEDERKARWQNNKLEIIEFVMKQPGHLPFVVEWDGHQLVKAQKIGSAT